MNDDRTHPYNSCFLTDSAPNPDFWQAEFAEPN